MAYAFVNPSVSGFAIIRALGIKSKDETLLFDHLNGRYCAVFLVILLICQCLIEFFFLLLNMEWKDWPVKLKATITFLGQSPFSNAASVLSCMWHKADVTVFRSALTSNWTIKIIGFSVFYIFLNSDLTKKGTCSPGCIQPFSNNCYICYLCSSYPHGDTDCFLGSVTE